MATQVTLKSEHTFVTRQGGSGTAPVVRQPFRCDKSQFGFPSRRAAAEAAATPGPGPSFQVEPNHLSVRPSIRRAASNLPDERRTHEWTPPNCEDATSLSGCCSTYVPWVVSGLFALFNEMEIIFLIIAEVTFSAGDFPLFLGPSVGVVTHATQARYRASHTGIK